MAIEEIITETPRTERHISYKTSDGKGFWSRSDAESHEAWVSLLEQVKPMKGFEYASDYDWYLVETEEQRTAWNESYAGVQYGKVPAYYALPVAIAPHTQYDNDRRRSRFTMEEIRLGDWLESQQ